MISWGMADETGVEQEWADASGSMMSFADLVGDPKMWTEWKVGTTKLGGTTTGQGTRSVISSMQSLPATASG